MKTTHIAITLIIVQVLTACSAVKQCKTPELNLPETIVGGTYDTLTIADIEWWRFYGDSNLCDIINRTLDYNRNIKAAVAHIEQLREFYRIKKADLLPSVTINVMADHETNNYAGQPSKQDPEFDLKANISWEADLWGRLRWAKRKGEAEWLASVEDERALRMTLIAEVADAYFRLVALDNEISIVHRTLETRREGVAKAKLRFEGGLTSELVYQQAQVEYATTAALIPDLEKRIKITENTLCLLMGAYPGEKIYRSSADDAFLAPDSVPVGIPSQLLKRRPDIRVSELQLIASMSEVGVAYADRFPRLTFNLQGGWENDDLKGFFSSPFSYVAGQLVSPVFSFGKKKARYKAALAAYDESRIKYEQKVLEVMKETDDAVTTYRNVRETTALKRDSRNAALKYVKLAELQYRAGSINYIEVLDAQRRYFDAQIGLSNAVRDENLALVQLYKALGGGWKST